MRVPYGWLKEYLTSAPELPELCHLLTMGGLEVEEARDWTAICAFCSSFDRILKARYHQTICQLVS